MLNNKKMPHVAVVFEAKDFESISSKVAEAMMNLVVITDNMSDIKFEHQMIADCLSYIYKNVHDNEMGYIDLDAVMGE